MDMTTALTPLVINASSTCSSARSHPFNTPGRTAYNGKCLPCFEPHDAITGSFVYLIGIIANLWTILLIVCNLLKCKGGGNGTRLPGSSIIPTLLVLALCTTDFTCILLGEMVWLISQFHGSWLGGRVSYLYSMFVIATTTRLSRCIVVVMGLERYLSFKHPFLYDQSATNRRVGNVLLILTLYSILAALIYFAALAGHGAIHEDGHSCDKASTLTTNSTVELVYDAWTFLESVILLGILVYCNIVVIFCMKKLKARINLICPRNKQEYLQQKDMIHGVPAEFSRLMVAITIVSLINTVPYEIRVVVNKFDVWPSPPADVIAVHLYLSIAIINPLLYGLFRRKSRRKIRKTILRLCRCCCPRNKVDPEPSSSAGGIYTVDT